MPTIPSKYTLTNVAPDVMNAIRNEATTNYKEYVPYATPDADSIRSIGAVLMDSPDLRNQFLQTLVNRIARVIVTSKTYENPWAVFKKGILEFGEVVENIFIEISKPFQYNPDTAQNTVFKREIPDVRTSFHVMNYQKYYKQTIDDKQLSIAFLSWDGVTDFISRIINAMYTAANYDEFMVMKYMIAKKVLNSGIKLIVPANTNPSTFVEAARGTSNMFTFMSSEYNEAGVHTYTMKEDQYIIIPAMYDATIDVNVLASAFNMDKAEFFGHRILVDGFGNFDIERLNSLLSADPNYTEFSSDEMNWLNKNILAVVVDKDWFMIFDNYMEMASLRNPEGISWNYWLHVWKTFSINPFANAVAFVTEVASITNVTVSLDTTKPNGNIANPIPGNKFYLKATVVNNGASEAVNNKLSWSSDNARAIVSESGVVTIVSGSGEKTATITATSLEDSTKKGTYIITFAAAT